MATTTCKNTPFISGRLNGIPQINKNHKNTLKLVTSIHRRILLYTNIPHSDGKQSILYYLQNNPNNYTRPEEPTPDVSVKLIDILYFF